MFLSLLLTLLFSIFVTPTPHNLPGHAAERPHAPHSHDSHPDNWGRCDFHPSLNPKCWGDYSLDTNYYDVIPDTGKVREYWFTIQNGSAAVDGVERMVLTVNGQFPGPTIVADWGDTVIVHVHNALAHNGTSIHFHGIRQGLTTQMDGVASITQCPVAPGDSITYTWKAEQYGHSWYHSHFAVQAWNGVFGGIIINGPCSAPYDEDVGIVMLNDWFHETTDVLWDTAKTGFPPTAQIGLINGMGVYGHGGKRWTTTFTKGKRYRLRLVNGAIDTHFKFMIDGHKMTVVANDLVPIKPYITEVLSIGIGQRYDVIVDADQNVGDFWLRAVPDTACSADNEMESNIKGIVRYDKRSNSDPTTKPYNYTNDCFDENMADLIPYVSLDVDEPKIQETFDLSYQSGALWKWTLNKNSFMSNWSKPTLREVVSISTNYEFYATQNVVRLDEKDVFVYFVIESAFDLTHPVHLHGHDFWVLGQQANASFSGETPLHLENPPRRDVAMLPAAGYLVIGFVTDNPGVWLMHCHIGWHASQGFALQLLERASEIPRTCDKDNIDSTCAKWDAYAGRKHVLQEDSGI